MKLIQDIDVNTYIDNWKVLCNWNVADSLKRSSDFSYGSGIQVVPTAVVDDPSKPKVLSLLCGWRSNTASGSCGAGTVYDLTTIVRQIDSSSSRYSSRRSRSLSVISNRLRDDARLHAPDPLFHLCAQL